MKTEEQIEKIKYLSRYCFLQKEIDRKINEIEAWRSKLYRVTPVISDMPIGRVHSGNDIMLTGIISVIELQERLRLKLTDLIETRDEVEASINAVDNDLFKEILKCRYMDGKTWEEIAVSNHYSWLHTHRLHEKALDQIKML
jgi:DNA-directed RNA polymerase specialized sigma subunit